MLNWIVIAFSLLILVTKWIFLLMLLDLLTWLGVLTFVDEHGELLYGYGTWFCEPGQENIYKECLIIVLSSLLLIVLIYLFFSKLVKENRELCVATK